MLGNFSPFYCRQQIFFKIVSKNSLGNTIRAWIQIRYGLDLAQWLSGRVLDSRPKGCGLEPHRRHCVVVLEQDTFILA